MSKACSLGKSAIGPSVSGHGHALKTCSIRHILYSFTAGRSRPCAVCSLLVKVTRIKIRLALAFGEGLSL